MGMTTQKPFLWKYHYFQRSCQFLGKQNNTKTQKRFSMADPRRTVPRKPIYHTTVWLLIYHPTLCTPLQEVCCRRRAAEARRVPWCVPGPWRDTLPGAAGFSASSAKGTHGSVALLTNLTMSWEGRWEHAHLDKDYYCPEPPCPGKDDKTEFSGCAELVEKAYHLPGLDPSIVFMCDHVLMAPGLLS